MSVLEPLENWMQEITFHIVGIEDCMGRALDQLDECDKPELDQDYVTRQVNLQRQHIRRAKLLVAKLPDTVQEIIFSLHPEKCLTARHQGMGS